MQGFIARVWYLVLVAITIPKTTQFAYAILDDDASDLERFCKVHTQTSIARSMFEYSSPKGSSSYRQFHELIQSFSYFNTDIISSFGQVGLFESVADNLSLMMEGYGLKKTTDKNDPNAILFLSVFLNNNGRKLIEDEEAGVILVQTEQLCCSKFLSEDVFLNLQACERQGRNCVILEYSESNQKYMKEKLGVSQSVILLPIMLQGRLDQFYRRHHLPANWERSTDVSFFGYFTEHRKSALETINNPNPMDTKWEMVIEQDHDKLRVARTYLHSKVCLIVHAFEQSGPGEYHRLSELGISGCVPVMESFEDTIGMDVYKLCGGVVFGDLEELPNQIARILEEIEIDEEGQDESIRRRAEWWKARVHWGTILVEVFGVPKGSVVEL